MIYDNILLRHKKDKIGLRKYTVLLLLVFCQRSLSNISSRPKKKLVFFFS